MYDFYNEIIAAGGNDRFNSDGSPLLPALQYAVSIIVTPEDLTNVTIKINNQEVTSPIYLEAGSTIVTLNAGYVATLPAGTHTLSIVSLNGTATATFTVNPVSVDTDTAIKSPKTSDQNHLILFFAFCKFLSYFHN